MVYDNKQSYRVFTHRNAVIYNYSTRQLNRYIQARIQRGGTGGPDPPWDLSEVGSCVEVWWIVEGVQRLCLPYYHQFFSGSLRSPILYKHITYIHTSKFNVHPFLYFPYPTYKKNQLPLSCCYEKAFSYFSCLDLHDFTPYKPKMFWGRTPRPPIPTFYYVKTTMSSVCFV